jgi:hypothetical protein
MKRLICALLIGLAFGSSRFLTLKMSDGSHDRLVQQLGLTLATPGAFVGLIAAHGRLDDINFLLADLANLRFLFWIGIRCFVSCG